MPAVLETKENIVMIEGHVKREGAFAWKKAMHFSDVIVGPEMLLPNPDVDGALILREVQPTRRLDVSVFSPKDAFAAPKGEQDPLLQPGDKILLFGYEEDRNELLLDVIETLNLQASKTVRRQVVTVAGHVRFPGTYPLMSSMKVDDLINLAGGLTEKAYSKEAEVTRYSYNEEEEQVIDYFTVKLGGDSNMPLEAEDALRILQLPSWKEQETILLEGEVMFPGIYTIQNGETIASVLKRAGGLTEYAYAKAAKFTRQHLKELEAERIEKYKDQIASDIAASNIDQQSADAKVALTDAEFLLENLGNVEPVGRMVIDLEGIMDEPDEFDVFLKDGDVLSIPRYRQAITVVGEVQFPTSHRFKKKLDSEDYIDLSGGITQKADDDRVYVVRADGSVFLPNKGWFTSSPDIEAGDTIVVPLDADRIKPLTLWSSVSQIIYQMALGAAAVASF